MAQNENNTNETTSEEMSVCMEISAAESIPGLNQEAPKASQCK